MNTKKNSCLLSICIATRNRCKLLTETISTILPQISEEIEIIVVDGASSDGTFDALTYLSAKDARVKYFYNKKNGGIDQDYDKAVEYASGEYCWLMSDDDWFLPNAINLVVEAISKNPSLVVVDAEVRDANQERLLLASRLNLSANKTFKQHEMEKLFIATARQLSFIGSVVIRRSLWMGREREKYYGSFFIHVGIIFQKPLPEGAIALKDPCLSIRYGNASWSPRAFEIWTIFWPSIIWNLETISEKCKNKVTPERPYESIKEIFLLRSTGIYTKEKYYKYIDKQKNISYINKKLCLGIALIPGILINLFSITYIFLFSKNRDFAIYNLNISKLSIKNIINQKIDKINKKQI